MSGPRARASAPGELPARLPDGPLTDGLNGSGTTPMSQLIAYSRVSGLTAGKRRAYVPRGHMRQPQPLGMSNKQNARSSSLLFKSNDGESDEALGVTKGADVSATIISNAMKNSSAVDTIDENDPIWQEAFDALVDNDYEPDEDGKGRENERAAAPSAPVTSTPKPVAPARVMTQSNTSQKPALPSGVPDEIRRDIQKKDGEISILRDRIGKMEREMEVLRVKAIEAEQSSKANISNFHNELALKVKTLESELAFKDQEVRELNQAKKSMMSQLISHKSGQERSQPVPTIAADKRKGKKRAHTNANQSSQPTTKAVWSPDRLSPSQRVAKEPASPLQSQTKFPVASQGNEHSHFVVRQEKSLGRVDMVLRRIMAHASGSILLYSKESFPSDEGRMDNAATGFLDTLSTCILQSCITEHLLKKLTHLTSMKNDTMVFASGLFMIKVTLDGLEPGDYPSMSLSWVETCVDVILKAMESKDNNILKLGAECFLALANSFPDEEDCIGRIIASQQLFTAMNSQSIEASAKSIMIVTLTDILCASPQSIHMLTVVANANGGKPPLFEVPALLLQHSQKGSDQEILVLRVEVMRFYTNAFSLNKVECLPLIQNNDMSSEFLLLARVVNALNTAMDKLESSPSRMENTKLNEDFIIISFELLHMIVRSSLNLFDMLNVSCVRCQLFSVTCRLAKLPPPPELEFVATRLRAKATVVRDALANRRGGNGDDIEEDFMMP